VVVTDAQIEVLAEAGLVVHQSDRVLGRMDREHRTTVAPA